MDQMFLFHLHQQTPTSMLPFPFLVRSLKKIYLPLAETKWAPFSGRNFIWLAVFCPRLNSLTTSFDLSERDVEYLSEYKEVFKHRSRVKKLAISFVFVASPSGTKSRQWKLNENQKSGLSKAQKEQCLSDLLLVTWELEAFEINPTHSRDYDLQLTDEPNYETSFSSLSSSQSSLKHLRVFSSLVGRVSVFSSPNSYFTTLQPFKNLKVLSTDLFGFSQVRKGGVAFGVEIFQLSWYSEDFKNYVPSPVEDCYQDFVGIEAMLDTHILPNLKTIIIPKHPINLRNEVDESPARIAVWNKKKRDLLSTEYFKNGRIKLVEFEAGEKLWNRESCFR